MRARRGITLFESIAAIAIVAVTAISALSAAGAELRTAHRARRALEAEALLQERVSALELLTDRDLQSLPDTVAEGRFARPLDDYRWTTTSAPSRDYPGLYDVEIRIDWGDGATAVRTAQYRRPPFAVRGRR